ncbi:energy transducer TonB [Bacteroidales bacterium OttesenSCG-928-M11]|nr:energy transducer TonB [Bacteroidales bacterium OttesenSCG-928-M11]
MKCFLFFVIVLFFSFTSCGNSTHGDKGELLLSIAENEIISPVQEVFSHVNIMPSFPGGDTSLKQWLQTNLEYPTSAMEFCIEGKVEVRFIVNPDGSISNAQIKRGLTPDLDKEALRLINQMPDWVPGLLDGTSVPVWYSLPIIFQLNTH